MARRETTTMKTRRKMLTICAALLAVPATASAQESASRAYVARDHIETKGPNRAMLHTGIWTLGLAYVPAVIVATQSERSADKNLYIPVAGPWMDLATRGTCPSNRTCNNETLNKVLIVTDGIFQGVGALNVIGSFLFPETRITTTTALRLRPTRLPGGAYGLMAIGTF